MAEALVKLSNELAEIVRAFNPYMVSVRARRHYPSGGIRWGADLIVTADHTVEREEEIAVTLADGTTASAVLIGRDPGTDLAVLKISPAAAFREPEHADEISRRRIWRVSAR